MNKLHSTELHSTGAAAGAPTAHASSRGPRRTTPRDVLHKVSTRIHRTIFRASKGRIFGKAFGMPIAELVTTGRRSGKERSTGVDLDDFANAARAARRRVSSRTR